MKVNGNEGENGPSSNPKGKEINLSADVPMHVLLRAPLIATGFSPQKNNFRS
jgi:hypothetical protein